MAEWHGALDGDGNKYFYNEAGETRWDRPADYVTSEEEEEEEEAEVKNEAPAAAAHAAEEQVVNTDAELVVQEADDVPELGADAPTDDATADAGDGGADAAGSPDLAVPTDGDSDALAEESAAETAAAAAVKEEQEEEREAKEAEQAAAATRAQAEEDSAVAAAEEDAATAAAEAAAQAAAADVAAAVAAAVQEAAEEEERQRQQAAADAEEEEEEENKVAGRAFADPEAVSGSQQAADSVAELERKIRALRSEKEQLQQDKHQLQSELAKERVKAISGGVGGGGGSASGASSDKTIEQAEKLMKTQQKYAQEKEKATKLESEVGAVREVMVRHIAGPSADGVSYQNVPLAKLLDLYKKSFSDRAQSSDSRPGSRPATATGSRPATAAGGSSGSGSGNGNADSKKLQARVTELEQELEQLQEANDRLRRSGHVPNGDGIVDYASYPAKLQNQKKMFASSQAKLKDANEKIVKLSQHIEKLMLHLKHESAAKVKAAKTVRQLEETTSAQKEYIGSLEAKLGNRDKTIKQLRAGAKILEDQLQLMDEKYIEIRGKLDWTRQQSKKEVAKIQQEANDLRAKWALAGGLDLEHLIGKNKSSKMTKLKSEKPASGCVDVSPRPAQPTPSDTITIRPCQIMFLFLIIIVFPMFVG